MASMNGERQPGHSPPAGTAFALRDPLPWAAFAGLARLGEELGYRGVFLPEIEGRDAFATAAALAGETRDLLLGTGIVPMTSRSSRLTAMGAATVHERSAGRAILGLGTGPARAGALDELRAQVREIRAFWAAAPGTVTGPTRLPVPSPPPVWTAALGPRSVRLAGEISDGVLLNWCTPERAADAGTSIAAAAQDRGRDPDHVGVAVYVRACLGQDERSALAAAQAAAGAYASYPAYARQFEAMGLGDAARAAGAAHEAGRPADVPEELVHAVCLLGDAERARARLSEYRHAGAHLPVVYPLPVPGPDPAASIEATLRAVSPSA
jgi:alkanesulfonate monooxygenase SsuD/methylene tetrahydromethanopterin reductase-like flavin-dependent oxidoreductase (luciferase family)